MQTQSDSLVIHGGRWNGLIINHKRGNRPDGTPVGAVKMRSSDLDMRAHLPLDLHRVSMVELLYTSDHEATVVDVSEPVDVVREQMLDALRGYMASGAKDNADECGGPSHNPRKASVLCQTLDIPQDNDN